ncbi:MAG: hypothetical protein J4432_05000 [DPANN group archaeon]|nr:hypothetical protein [DPANN group archaeon]
MAVIDPYAQRRATAQARIKKGEPRPGDLYITTAKKIEEQTGKRPSTPRDLLAGLTAIGVTDPEKVRRILADAKALRGKPETGASNPYRY